MRDVEIACLVDPDSRLFASRSAAVQKLAGNTPQCVQDFRRVLDDKTLDAVSIVTPNHWHALLAIWACQAGKDVHVEKPCSHNIVEGRRIVEAARKYDRIVQHGTQRRSDPKWIMLTADVRNGKYGKLRLAYAYATGLARASASGIRSNRPRSWTTTSGSARRPCIRTARISCTTTGTGSGISATARSGTWARINWTWRAGPCPTAPRRRASSAWAAASATRTRAKRPTPS